MDDIGGMDFKGMWYVVGAAVVVVLALGIAVGFFLR